MFAAAQITPLLRPPPSWLQTAS